ncbi:putative O-linked N-acetylglucosamine transferase, SPINDLY family [Tritonibacter multivorans]|uniref:Putative O-linked N-acetylglucosamine transferase, SPINDLY family n=2 Tax=Tritonibacter multivorans TaxID=928856 RepID=A0A0P1G249_9RHOB|nr:UDP-N-acetylglucosamine-peptide N-acetylglucosaminyltransferase [Tritonibacter multivorans]MDA7419575.1 UDP-N-acetylglucosamine-peptide N-acetylglucosaminyltransferase [Tritonibacter multivorans]CUH75742.1 putative O-linked N-acetylglucosamine transferase, SPINDLY family [Tritonibacter multivorans]SFC61793.1 Predicted O-linked N-acetylglucosamine transferase, SPINDLY family [Tritonibacter multivorans]
MTIAFPQAFHAPVYNSAIAYLKARNFPMAEAHLRRSIAEEGATALSFHYLAQVLSQMGGRQKDALAPQAAALKLAPRHPVFIAALGLRLQDAGKEHEGLTLLEEALAIDPNNLLALPWALRLRRRFMLWTGQEQEDAALATLLNSDYQIDPLMLLTYVDDPLIQLKYAGLSAPRVAEKPMKAHAAHEKIRIGYFSADFYQHATMHLMKGLLREHDRDRFEFNIYDLKPVLTDTDSEFVREFADVYHDVSSLTADQIADLARKDEIDIAIDLKGQTKEARPEIFALRAAPVQISFLGFPGTSAMQAMDYMVADKMTIPEGDERYFSEKIMRMPGCYQPTDNARSPAQKGNLRQNFGLPEDKFIFANFNHPHKVGPREFAAWMRVLRETSNSVLLYFTGGSDLTAELARQATDHGVDPSRILTCGMIPQHEHLDRMAQVDLCLDCFAYNAHTTASDALWAGVPLLTLCGSQFSARVATSILSAAGIDGLSVTSENAFVDKAVALSQDPDATSALKAQIARNRESCSLFDTIAWTSNFEHLLEKAHARRVAGQPPAHLSV